MGRLLLGVAHVMVVNQVAKNVQPLSQVVGRLPTMLTVTEAAAATGKSRQAILKNIHSGRLSAQRSDNGAFAIDGAELSRVFDLHLSNGTQRVPGVVVNPEDEVATSCQAELEGCRERIAMLERLLAQSETTVLDLRQRLDTATEENTRLSMVLTTQLPQPKMAKTGWWQRLLGGNA
jgi:hypothetical protein